MLIVSDIYEDQLDICLIVGCIHKIPTFVQKHSEKNCSYKVNKFSLLQKSFQIFMS